MGKCWLFSYISYTFKLQDIADDSFTEIRLGKTCLFYKIKNFSKREGGWERIKRRKYGG